MASISPNKSGGYSVQWYQGRKRPTIYLGKVTKNFAEEFKRGTEQLVLAQKLGEPLDYKTSRWLTELAPLYRQKLADKGLASRSQATTVRGLCAHMLWEVRRKQHKGKLAKSTVTKHRELARCLVRYFDRRLLREVTEGDAEEFRTWLELEGDAGGGPLADTTASSRCKLAKKFFRRAERKKWVDNNPFADMQQWVTDNPDRDMFVEREWIQKLVDAASDWETRLAIVMARYLGLRMISELRELRWEWVEWGGEGLAPRLTVRCVKTERFKRRKWRRPPIFPELMPYLLEAAERAPEGSEFIFQRVRHITGAALRNRVERLCLRTGVPMWPNFWNNVRASRYTELCDEWPEHVVIGWMGHSKKIARKHYGRIREEHYQRATQGVGGNPNQVAKERPTPIEGGTANK